MARDGSADADGNRAVGGILRVCPRIRVADTERIGESTDVGEGRAENRASKPEGATGRGDASMLVPAGALHHPATVAGSALRRMPEAAYERANRIVAFDVLHVGAER